MGNRVGGRMRGEEKLCRDHTLESPCWWSTLPHTRRYVTPLAGEPNERPYLPREELLARDPRALYIEK